jgi:hypothetical protein
MGLASWLARLIGGVPPPPPRDPLVEQRVQRLVRAAEQTRTHAAADRVATARRLAALRTEAARLEERP